MSTNQTLARALELATRAIEADPEKLNTYSQVLDLAQELASTVLALDDEMTGQGPAALPERWKA